MFSQLTGQGDPFAAAQPSDLPVYRLAKFSIRLQGNQTTPRRAMSRRCRPPFADPRPFWTWLPQRRPTPPDSAGLRVSIRRLGWATGLAVVLGVRLAFSGLAVSQQEKTQERAALEHLIDVNEFVFCVGAITYSP